MVPVVDLSRRAARYGDAFLAATSRILASGHLLLGDELTAFEAEFAVFTGADHCVALASGAAAIQVGLAALGVGPGDEVLVPAFTAVPPEVSEEPLYAWAGWTHRERARALLALDEKAEGAGVKVPDRYGLLYGVWFLLPYVAWESAQAASDFRADVKSLVGLHHSASNCPKKPLGCV